MDETLHSMPDVGEANRFQLRGHQRGRHPRGRDEVATIKRPTIVSGKEQVDRLKCK